MARRELFRSIVLTDNAEFKQKAIAMLNNIAFVAEKLQAADVADLVQRVTTDELVRNVVIDARSPEVARRLVTSEPFANAMRSTRDLFALIYVNASQLPAIEAAGLGKLRGLRIAELPMDRAHFMDVFYTRRTAASQKAAVPKKAAVSEEMRAAAREAGEHLKTALEQINGIAADPTKLDYLAVIGQRFNGMMGTFAFFASTPGAKELAEIGRIIDGIARSYAKAPRPVVDSEHLQLLLGCCRATLPLLRAVAFGEAVPPATARELKLWTASFEGDSSLLKRQAVSQSRIDSAIGSKVEQDEAQRQAFFETSQHLKSAIEHLNVVFKDRARLDALAAVGQLFNGVFGTFAFYRERVGSDALIDLSTLIDDLCRSYGQGAGEQVVEEHVQLLRDAAETCFYILKDLREGRQPAEAHKGKVRELVTRAQQDERISKRQSIGQADVDQLLDDLLAA
jgi:hypothetical protein